MITTLDQIVRAVKDNEPKTIAVAQAADDDVLLSLDAAHRLGLAKFILIGNPDAIRDLAKRLGVDWISDGMIVPAFTDAEAARAAVAHVRDGRADTLFKGHLHTGTFLKAVLDKETGLRSGSLLSQCSVYENPRNGRLMYLTDCAMNVAPDLMQKKSIIENAVWLAGRLGNENPKVACLTALEQVNPDMPETMEAAILAKMNDRGQIKNCVVDGPFAMDNAVSVEAAKNKKVGGPVAGDADILLAPDIKCGNAVHKTITNFTQMKNAALCIGAKIPIIMTSRTDPVETKTYSVAMGCLVS